MVNIANDHETSPVTTTERREQGPRRHVGTEPAWENAFPVTGRTATATRYLLAGIRIALGWVFLWAFLDKLFGLGRSTPAANA